MKTENSKKMGDLVIRVTAIGIHPYTGAEETQVWNFGMDEGMAAKEKYFREKKVALENPECHSVTIDIVVVCKK